MPPGAEHVFLCGAPGCGKSTVGRVLAARLHRPFAEVDDAVVARAGRSIAAVFRDEGEPAFRALESAVLADLAARPQPAVIALGGGTLLDARNRALVAERGRTFYLRASAATLEARLARHAVRRPLLAQTPVGALLEGRRAIYESAGDAVDVDGRAPHDVAAAIAALL